MQLTIVGFLFASTTPTLLNVRLSRFLSTLIKKFWLSIEAFVKKRRCGTCRLSCYQLHKRLYQVTKCQQWRESMWLESCPHSTPLSSWHFFQTAGIRNVSSLKRDFVQILDCLKFKGIMTYEVMPQSKMKTISYHFRVICNLHQIKTMTRTKIIITCSSIRFVLQKAIVPRSLSNKKSFEQ